MGVYARGSKLWIRFRDAKGMWRDASTGYNVGQEELAQTMHDETVARIGATTKTVKHAPARGLTVRGRVAPQAARAWPGLEGRRGPTQSPRAALHRGSADLRGTCTPPGGHVPQVADRPEPQP